MRHLFFALTALLSVFFPALFLLEVYGRDWRYFNSLSLLVRSSVWSYGVFPLHDPWCGGGSNLLANPQSRVFSPMGLLDVFLSPYWANLSGLVIYAGFGLAGMYRLLAHFGVPRAAALLGSALFINGTWFGLHFAEGHIPFGSMQLLPWVLWAFLTLERRSSQLLLGALLALFLLDGGIYTFIFSLFLIGSALAAGWKSPREVFAAARLRPLFTAGVVAASALLAAPKILPVLVEWSSRRPQLGSFEIPFTTLITSFFWPTQRVIFPVPGTILSFQEFGCYLGLFTFTFVALSLARDRMLRAGSWKLIAVAGFWLWVAGGWLPVVNPWRAFELIPLVNNAHVQSRVLILMFLFYVIVAARALGRLDPRRRWVIVFFVFLWTESVLARNFPFADFLNYKRVRVTDRLITSDRLEQTVLHHERPHLYLERNLASKGCYEPAALPVRVRARTEKGYRGEAYFSSGSGQASIRRFVPGSIHLDLNTEDTQGTGRVTVNTHDLGHWRVDAPAGAKVVSAKGELLEVEVPPGRHEVRLSFRPWYLPWVTVAWLLGLVLSGLLVLQLRHGSDQSGSGGRRSASGGREER